MPPAPQMPCTRGLGFSPDHLTPPPDLEGESTHTSHKLSLNTKPGVGEGSGGQEASQAACRWDFSGAYPAGGLVTPVWGAYHPHPRRPAAFPPASRLWGDRVGARAQPAPAALHRGPR